MKELPAVSVIIPMFNAEKYVGECLDSVLNQTFQNFEVIVVDDCSTDSSVDVVKSYAPKFNGRLQLVHMNKNSGGAGFPRNKGINLARGEYFLSIDADDVISPTALEELYSIAKEFDADVVACEKYYNVPAGHWYDENFIKDLMAYSYQNANLVDKPTFLTDDLSERVQRFSRSGFLWNVWSKLIRRDFIFENEFTFANTIIEDMIFTGCLVFTAKRFVLVPNVINFYREIDGSVSRTKERGFPFFRRYVKALTSSFAYFNEFLSGREFFRQHPDMKYLALKKVWDEVTNYFILMYDQFPPYEFDEILREELSCGDNLALSAFACNMTNAYRLYSVQLQEDIAKLEKSERENKAYIAELEKFAVQSQRRVAELEAELNRLKGKE